MTPPVGIILHSAADTIRSALSDIPSGNGNSCQAGVCNFGAFPDGFDFIFTRVNRVGIRADISGNQPTVEKCVGIGLFIVE